MGNVREEAKLLVVL